MTALNRTPARGLRQIRSGVLSMLGMLLVFLLADNVQARAIRDLESWPYETHAKDENTSLALGSEELLLVCRDVKQLEVSCVKDGDLAVLDEFIALKGLSIKASVNVTNRSVNDIAKLKSLELLDVAGTSMSDLCWAEFAKLPKLREIVLSSRQAGGDGLRSIATSSNVTSLRYFCPDRAPLASELAALSKCGSLRELAIHSDSFGDAQLEGLSTLSQLTHLAICCVVASSGAPVPRQPPETLATKGGFRFLRKLHNLTHLYLRGVRQLGDSLALVISSVPVLVSVAILQCEADWAATLGALRSKATVTKLAISPWQTGNSHNFVEGLSKLAGKSELTVLKCGGFAPTSTIVQIVKQAHSLEAIYLPEFAGEGLPPLVAALKSIESLNELHCTIATNDQIQLLDIPKKVSITSLTVRLEHSVDVKECFARLGESRLIRRLDISLKAVPTDVIWSQLKGIRGLQSLDLRVWDKNAPFTASQAQVLASLSELERVSLATVRLSDGALIPLSKSKSLRRIGLALTMNTNRAGLSELGTTSLEAIDLSGTEIGIEEIEVLGRIRTLTLLDVSGCKYLPTELLLAWKKDHPKISLARTGD